MSEDGEQTITMCTKVKHQQNTFCLFNLEHASVSCPVSIQGLHPLFVCHLFFKESFKRRTPVTNGTVESLCPISWLLTCRPPGDTVMLLANPESVVVLFELLHF